MAQQKSSEYNRWSLIASVLIIGAISLVQPGCDCGSSDGITTPIVASVFPEQDSDTALVSTDVVAFFGRDMDETTIDETTFTLTEVGGVQIAAIVTYDAATQSATLDPDADLVSGTEYVATISATVLDTSGNPPLTRDYSWSFTVSQATELVSKDESGAVGDNSSAKSDIEGSGQYIVFESFATNLVPGSVTNGRSHIYRKDMITGEVLLVSSDNDGLEANNNSFSPRISNNGRFIVFESRAQNLVTTVGNNIGLFQVFLKDMETGTVTMISRNDLDASNNSGSRNPDISSSGRFIVFESDATNLFSDVSSIKHIYLADTEEPNSFTLISVDTSGVATVSGDSANAAVSSNGQLVVFESDASDLTDTPDNNGVADIFLRNVGDSVGTIPVTTHISVNSTGTASANAASSNPDINSNGQFVVFESLATDIDGGTGIRDIFLSDITNPATRITVINNVDANNDSRNPSISEDGRFVVFESLATNLDGGTIGKSDIFVSDESTIDDIRRLSLTSDDNSNNPRISSDGRYVSFDSPFSFTLDDTINGTTDVYRAHNSTF